MGSLQVATALTPTLRLYDGIIGNDFARAASTCQMRFLARRTGYAAVSTLLPSILLAKAGRLCGGAAGRNSGREGRTCKHDGHHLTL